MWVKLTNCKYYTGGGKRRSAVPLRIRNNQNIKINLADCYKSYSDKQIKRLVEIIRDYAILTSHETKVIRNLKPYQKTNGQLRRYERLKISLTNSKL